MMRYIMAVVLIGFGCYGMPAMSIGAGSFGMPFSESRYVADLYRGIARVILIDREGKLSDTDKFRTFHTSCLKMAIEAKNVGQYAGLAEFIDKTFEDELGLEVQPVDAAVKQKLIAACDKIAKRLDGL